jgi:hypothetical protein
MPQLFLPGGVNLHDAVVIRAVDITVEGVWPEAAFDLGDGLEETGGDVIGGARLLET